jgi:hypothetical protein
MTHVSQRRTFQSGDFRLTDARTGRDIDYWAQKQIIVQRFEWTALVGFCGIAHTGREYVPSGSLSSYAHLPMPRSKISSPDFGRQRSGSNARSRDSVR